MSSLYSFTPAFCGHHSEVTPGTLRHRRSNAIEKLNHWTQLRAKAQTDTAYAAAGARVLIWQAQLEAIDAEISRREA